MDLVQIHVPRVVGFCPLSHGRFLGADVRADVLQQLPAKRRQRVVLEKLSNDQGASTGTFSWGFRERFQWDGGSIAMIDYQYQNYSCDMDPIHGTSIHYQYL